MSLRVKSWNFIGEKLMRAGAVMLRFKPGLYNGELVALCFPQFEANSRTVGIQGH
jgi:hypothetical protein